MGLNRTRDLGKTLAAAIVRRQGIDPTRIPVPMGVTTTMTPGQALQLQGARSVSSIRNPEVAYYQDDILDAAYSANYGRFSDMVLITESCLSDGLVQGVLDVFTSGVARLPKVFDGDPELVKDFSKGFSRGDGDPRSLFDSVTAPGDLQLFARDMRLFDMCLGYLDYVDGLDYPLAKRLDMSALEWDPETGGLKYRLDNGQYSLVTPGDGHWIFGCSTRQYPWRHGIWRAIATAGVRKTESLYNLDSWIRKHASPIRAAWAPLGATPEDRTDLLKMLINFSGANSAVVLPVGYQLSLLESSGRGYEAYKQAIDSCNSDLVLALAGQSMTVDGGEGFSNGAVGLSIRQDQITQSASQLSAIYNDQVFPYVVARRYNTATRYVNVNFDARPPKDVAAAATAITGAASALTATISAYTAAKDAGIPMDPPDLNEISTQLGLKLQKPKAPERNQLEADLPIDTQGEEVA